MDELKLRLEVRAFLADHPYEARCDSWMRSFDPTFSRALGERGWIGINVPPGYGGRGGTHLERFIVTEELLRAGAPIAAHWVADRQIAPMLVKNGTESLRSQLLPGICRGETYFCIAISEPDAGSDVAAISMRAEKEGDRWILNGRKIWTTGAHVAHHIFAIVRTSRETDRHSGLTQFIISTDSPGLSVRPIEDMSGEAHFNELHFNDVIVSQSDVVGEVGSGWVQILEQLDYERTGPERVLSTYPLFEELARWAAGSTDSSVFRSIGDLAGWYAALRALSRSAAVSIDEGSFSAPTAAMVKDLGSRLEQAVADVSVSLTRSECDPSDTNDRLMRLQAQAQLYAPTFTLRGGTSEILRTIIAKRLLSLPS